MELLFLLSAIVSILTFAIISYGFIKRTKGSRRQKLPLFLIGNLYLIFAVILFFWSSEISMFNKIDFLQIYSLLLLLQTVFLLTSVYFQSKNQKIFKSLYFFLLIIPLLLLDLSYFSLIIPLAMFITLLSFLIYHEKSQRINLLLIIYSCFVLLSYLILVIQENFTQLIIFISTILFLLFLILFMEKQKNKREILIIERIEFHSPIINMLKHFLFIVIITNFIFIGTISIHELGHIATVKYFDCEETKLIYDFTNFPYTEAICNGKGIEGPLILGGLTLPFLVSIILLFVGGKFIKEIALQIIGFNLIIAHHDWVALSLQKGTIFMIMAIGIAGVILSIALLAKSRVE